MYPENVGRDEGHPAPFPEALPNRFINMYTFPKLESAGFAGDLVIDPFNGWGTTCVAAKRLGRRFIGVDLSPGFCNHAAARLARIERATKRTIMPASRPTRHDSRQRVLLD
jgi:DNA modification methylase